MSVSSLPHTPDVDYFHVPERPRFQPQAAADRLSVPKDRVACSRMSREWNHSAFGFVCGVLSPASFHRVFEVLPRVRGSWSLTLRRCHSPRVRSPRGCFPRATVNTHPRPSSSLWAFAPVSPGRLARRGLLGHRRGLGLCDLLKLVEEEVRVCVCISVKTFWRDTQEVKSHGSHVGVSLGKSGTSGGRAGSESLHCTSCLGGRF